MTPRRRRARIVSDSLVTVGLALLFTFGTDGLDGADASIVQDALRSQTIARSDDVFLRDGLNGERSDDAIGFAALLSLTLRAAILPPCDPANLGLFFCPSIPALLFRVGLARCTDTDLTIIVSRSLPLAALAVGWIGTLLPSPLPGEVGRRGNERRFRIPRHTALPPSSRMR